MICDPPNRTERAAVWLCRSATTAEGGVFGDAGDIDAPMVSWTHLRAVPGNWFRMSVSYRPL